MRIQWKQYHPFRKGGDESSVVTAEMARAVASALADELKGKFGASRVMLFGSLARGDFHKWSDIDIAVCGVPLQNYYRAVAYVTGFSATFKIDLVDAEDCPESLRELIEREGVDL